MDNSEAKAQAVVKISEAIEALRDASEIFLAFDPKLGARCILARVVIEALRKKVQA